MLCFFRSQWSLPHTCVGSVDLLADTSTHLVWSCENPTCSRNKRHGNQSRFSTGRFLWQIIKTFPSMKRNTCVQAIHKLKNFQRNTSFAVDGARHVDLPADLKAGGATSRDLQRILDRGGGLPSVCHPRRFSKHF